MIHDQASALLSQASALNARQSKAEAALETAMRACAEKLGEFARDSEELHREKQVLIRALNALGEQHSLGLSIADSMLFDFIKSADERIRPVGAALSCQGPLVLRLSVPFSTAESTQSEGGST